MDSASATSIIPGFVARDSQGLQTTLGRNGSDFSASIFGKLLDAGEIVIWTDVDGVLSADPRRVPDATVIDALSYEEAMELAYFGAKVIHPQTMAPAVENGIPIWIRNTFAPDRPGSVIQRQRSANHAVKGITSIERIALVNVEGAGMIGVPGNAQRLFSALREGGISVILISQASSSIRSALPSPWQRRKRQSRLLRTRFQLRTRARPAAEGGIVDRLQHSRGSGRRHGGHAGRCGEGVQLAGRRRCQCASDRTGFLGAQYLGRN